MRPVQSTGRRRHTRCVPRPLSASNSAPRDPSTTSLLPFCGLLVVSHPYRLRAGRRQSGACGDPLGCQSRACSPRRRPCRRSRRRVARCSLLQSWTQDRIQACPAITDLPGPTTEAPDSGRTSVRTRPTDSDCRQPLVSLSMSTASLLLSSAALRSSAQACPGGSR